MSSAGAGRNKIIDFWVAQYEKVHGFTPMMERRDCILLHKLRNHFDDYALTYAIKTYMRETDDWVAKTGWSVPAFKSRVQGYVAAYHKSSFKRAAESDMGRIVGRIANGRAIPRA